MAVSTAAAREGESNSQEKEKKKEEIKKGRASPLPPSLPKQARLIQPVFLLWSLCRAFYAMLRMAFRVLDSGLGKKNKIPILGVQGSSGDGNRWDCDCRLVWFPIFIWTLLCRNRVLTDRHVCGGGFTSIRRDACTSMYYVPTS
jgi:hypothetical protein